MDCEDGVLVHQRADVCGSQYPYISRAHVWGPPYISRLMYGYFRTLARSCMRYTMPYINVLMYGAFHTKMRFSQ